MTDLRTASARVGDQLALRLPSLKLGDLYEEIEEYLCRLLERLEACYEDPADAVWALSWRARSYGPLDRFIGSAEARTEAHRRPFREVAQQRWRVFQTGISGTFAADAVFAAIDAGHLTAGLLAGMRVDARARARKVNY